MTKTARKSIYGLTPKKASVIYDTYMNPRENLGKAGYKIFKRLKRWHKMSGKNIRNEFVGERKG